MNEWRGRMLKLCKKVGMKTLLLSKYIDSCTNVVRILKLGAVLSVDLGKIICERQKKEDIRLGMTQPKVIMSDKSLPPLSYLAQDLLLMVLKIMKMALSQILIFRPGW